MQHFFLENTVPTVKNNPFQYRFLQKAPLLKHVKHLNENLKIFVYQKLYYLTYPPLKEAMIIVPRTFWTINLKLCVSLQGDYKINKSEFSDFSGFKDPIFRQILGSRYNAMSTLLAAIR